MAVLARDIKRLAVAAAVALAASGGGPALAGAPSKAQAGGSQSVHSVLGSYLAGRMARGEHDTPAAAGYYAQALAKDPDSPILLENTFALAVMAGDWPRALALAEDVVKTDRSHRTARYALAVKAFADGDYEAADQHLAAARKGPIADLTTLLGQAWIRLAQFRPDDALERLDRIQEADWSRFYQLYHKGLIADLAGWPLVAHEAFLPAFERNPRTLRMAEAYARHAVRSGDRSLALEILDRHLSESAGHAVSRALRDDIEAGRTPTLLVANARQGLAEVFYGIGDALASEGSVDMGATYLQLALLLKDDLDLAHLALGELHEANESHELALRSFARIPATSPMWANVQVRKAFSLNALERVDEAIELLRVLASELPNETRPLEAKGNILRSHERYEEAAEVYARAIALLKAPAREHWTLYYSRGVCFERTKQWDRAEPDFELALKLDPDQPLVLNYLGYSWVDQGVNLRRAMTLIRKAVKLKPDDGYFIDSLGWAYYRMGDYKTATKHLERAVELRPEDPVINDHLGDAYWQVGRRLEARYQWAHALTLDPEPEEVEKIQRKLGEGMAHPSRRAQAGDPPPPAGKAAD